MQLNSVRGQTARDIMFSVTGTITSPTKQLVLPEQLDRTSFIFQNLSSNVMYLEIGAGEATATVSGGAVTGISGVNNGFNYTIPPKVKLMGGGRAMGNTTFVGCTSPGYSRPGDSCGTFMQPYGTPAEAHAVVSGGSISSYVVENPGSGYVIAPWVCLENDTNDPNGVADPSTNSGSGIYVAAHGTITFNGTVCPTSPIAVYCATSGSTWQAKFTR